MRWFLLVQMTSHTVIGVQGIALRAARGPIADGGTLRHDKVLFPGIVFKMTDKTIADQWQESASGWARWAAVASGYMVPITEQMLDGAGVMAGSRVLDVGCGSGEQTVLAAKRVGPNGHVLAIDIAAPMIAAAERTIGAAGLTNVSTRVCAADAVADADETFDAVISRLVLMLIPDSVGAARAVLRTLHPGGRFAAIVIGDPAKANFGSKALDILARHGGITEWEDKPGSIRSLSHPDRLRAVLTAAGFTDVAVVPVQTTRRMESAEQMTTMIRDGFAFYKGLVAHLPPAAQEAAWAEVLQTLKPFEGPDGFIGPEEYNLAIGRKPLA